jgi:hypothetical protein
MTTYILDRLDEAEKEFFNKNKKTATTLLLGISAATALKEELGYNPEDDLKTYHGYKIIVDMSDDFMDSDKIEYLSN